jgi:Sigma-70 region 2
MLLGAWRSPACSRVRVATNDVRSPDPKGYPHAANAIGTRDDANCRCRAGVTLRASWSGGAGWARGALRPWWSALAGGSEWALATRISLRPLRADGSLWSRWTTAGPCSPTKPWGPRGPCWPECPGWLAGQQTSDAGFVFARHRPYVYRWLLRFVSNETLAEDLLSEVFLDVWRQAGRFQCRSSVSTWLMSIARHNEICRCLFDDGKVAGGSAPSLLRSL